MSVALPVEVEERLSNSGEERNLLAVCYQSQDAWLRISDKITQEDFTHPVNKSLWSVIDHMRNTNVEPTIIGIHDSLPDPVRKQVDEMGAWSFIQKLGELPVSVHNAEDTAKKIHDLTILRRGRTAGEDIVKLATATNDVGKFLEDAEMLVNDIEGGTGDEVVLLGSIAREYVNTKAANVKEIPGLTTGYEILDGQLQGLQKGRMYVVGARKKTGKSVFLLNLVKHIAIEKGIPVLYISTEQTQMDEVSRLLSMVSQVQEKYLNNGTFTGLNNGSADMLGAVDLIEKAPIYFAHDPFFTLSKLRRTIKKHVVLNKVQAVFFDYIKIPPDSMGSRDKWALVGELAYGLKAAASSMDVPVITAVQINRDGAQQMSFTGDIDSDAFANSDMIAQAMSVGLVLRPLNTEEQKDQSFGVGEKRILKITDNRHGLASYKGLFDFHNETITLEEIKTI